MPDTHIPHNPPADVPHPTPHNTGIGFQTAKVLLSKGYDVTIACRDPTRAVNAVTALKAADPSAPISSLQLDLASLASVRDAAAAWLDSGKQIDVLLNNAGGGWSWRQRVQHQPAWCVVHVHTHWIYKAHKAGMSSQHTRLSALCCAVLCPRLRP